MKICHIITSFGFGGAEKLLVDLVNIQANNNEIIIIYFKGEPILKSILDKRIHLIRIDLNIYCAGNVRKYLILSKPDIIHTHLGHGDLIGLWASRGLTVKRFCTMHNIWFKWDWRDNIIFLVYYLFFKTIAKNCTLVAISEAVFEHIELRLGVANSKIRLLHNAIPANESKNVSKEILRKEFNLDANSFCILFVGRLEVQKSVETLLLAANEVKTKISNVKILIVGDGSLKNSLEETTIRLGISNIVTFVGTSIQVKKYFEVADIFVLPSVFEGFGIVIVEAFRSSLPVIATNIEGPKELIKNNFNGLLFEPKDYIRLAENIMKLYQSKDLRENIGKNAFKTYENRFNIEDYSKKLFSFYLE